MDAQTFRMRWETDPDSNPLVRIGPSVLNGVDVPTPTKTFLETAGLPSSAAPFLSFNRSQLTRLSEEWNEDPANFRFRVLGIDGSGSPVCIEEPVGKVVLLDHDFEFAAVFVNESIEHLAGCLLAYRDFVDAVTSEGGEDAYLDGRYSEEAVRRLVEEIQRIDPRALDERSFWRTELEQLKKT